MECGVVFTSLPFAGTRAKKAVRAEKTNLCV